jgi:exonuclease VII large subunit
LPVTPQAPPALAPASLILPPLPEQVVDVGDNQTRLRQVQEVIARNREQALRQIANRLRESYLQEIRRLERERLAELEPEARAAIEAALARLREIFIAYADERGPLLIRLSLIVGFPDPDPESRVRPTVDTPLARLRFAEAVEFRTQIANLDAQYEASVQRLFTDVADTQAIDVARIRAEIAEMQARADERAREEAFRQVQLEQEQIRSVLADQSAMVVPADPGAAVTIPGSDPPVPPPAVPTPGRAETLARFREAVENDLQIWAAVRGYTLTTRGAAGRDATSEFIEWRTTRLGGR